MSTRQLRSSRTSRTPRTFRGGRGVVGVVAVAAVVAVVAAGCGQVSDAVTGQVSSGGEWNPVDVAPLGFVAGGAGGKAPVYEYAVVSKSAGLAVSTSPTLMLSGAPAGTQYEFTVMAPGDTTGGYVWRGQSNTNSVRVPAGVLVTGRTYVWQAVNVATKKLVDSAMPYAMSVDARRDSLAPSQTFGPFHVNTASGAVSFGAALRGGLSMTHRGEKESSRGLPAGWSLVADGQGFTSVQSLAGGWVGLISVSGAQYPFQPGAGGAYTPVLAAGRLQATGGSPTLVKNSDGTFTASTPAGQVSVFAAPGGDGVGWLTETFSGTAAAPKYGFTNGKLSTVTDPVSGVVTAQVNYQGEGDCPTPGKAFVTVPDGLLCEVVYPDKSTTTVSYVKSPGTGEAVIGRMVDFPDTQDSKPSVTDYGYDQGDRVVKVRGGLAADLIAAKVRDDDGLVDSLTYDSLGRVETVTKATALATSLAGSKSQTFTVAYSGESGGSRVSTVTGAGPKTSTGFASKVVYDTNTMLVLSSTNSKGETNSQTWNEANDLAKTSTNATKLTATNTYDSSGGLVSMSAPGGARQDYLYDQKFVNDQPQDMHGFDTVYYSNPQLTSVPAKREFGPTFANDTIPTTVAWNWPGSPVGGTGPWSARLTGQFDTTEPAVNGVAPVFGFKTPTTGAAANATLWIDNVLCPNAGCQLPLNPGTHTIRVDLAVNKPGADGGGGVQVDWAPPGKTMAPIPMSSIRPGYGLASTTTTKDALSTAAGVQDSVTNSQYANPWDGKATTGWIRGAETMKGASGYEPFTPQDAQFGRPVSTTSPAGSHNVASYYGADETVEVPCEGMGKIDQNGLPKTVIRTLADGLANSSDTGATNTYTSFYDRMGQVIASATNGHVTGCSYLNDVGALTKAVIPARGDQPGSTTVITPLVDGNPLKTHTEVTVDDGPTYTSDVETDLYGRAVTSTDLWGTTTATTYDPYTGATLTSTVTTKSGYKSTAVSTYTSDGDLATVTVNGQRLATLSVPNSAGTTVTYGNGVKVATAPNSTGGFGSQTWTTSDGKNLKYSTVTAPTSRILTERLTFGADTATSNYTYDKVGRLVKANLDTTMAVAHKNWAYAFSDTNTLGTNPKAGLNSNRTSQTIDAKTTTYGYNTADQLTTTTDPAITNKDKDNNNDNDIEYSTWGEITKLGTLNFTYNGDSHATKIVDTTTGDTTVYNRVTGEKTTTTNNGTPAVSRYTAGGIILDANNKPQWQTIALPGGANLLTNITGPGIAPNNPTTGWQHQTVRNQRMWTSDSAGKDTGDHTLYDPYGQTNTPTPATPAPATPAPATPAPATPAPADTSPAPKAAATSPTPKAAATGPAAAGGDALKPNYQWQAGNGLETQQVGATTIINMGARVYIPALGRFTSPDPVINGSANAYDYANQDPINQSDPTGNMPSWAKYLIATVITIAVTVASYGCLGPEAIGSATAFLTAAGVSQAAFAMSVGLGISSLANQAFLTAADGGHLTKTDNIIVQTEMGVSAAFGLVSGGAKWAAGRAIARAAAAAAAAADAAAADARAVAWRTVSNAAARAGEDFLQVSAARRDYALAASGFESEEAMGRSAWGRADRVLRNHTLMLNKANAGARWFTLPDPPLQEMTNAARLAEINARWFPAEMPP